MQNENINGLNIFEKTFLYTAYATYTTFSLIDEKSVIELMKTFDIFWTFYGLKQNKSTCEIAGVGALKGVKLVFCGMKCIDLIFNTRMRNLSIAGKNTVFKKIISKIVHLALVKVVPISTILELDEIKKHFIWRNGNPKITRFTRFVKIMKMEF